MDLDFHLLQALTRAPLASTADLARAVGLSRPAVHARLKKLEASGALEGFVATPNPAVFGRTAVSGMCFGADIHVDEVLALDDVIWCGQTVDGDTAFMGYTLDDGAFIERVSGISPGLVLDRDTQFPPLDAPLGPLEWKVLRAMLGDPRGPMSRMAEATGLGRKTILSRRTRLLENHAVQVQPLLRPPRRGPIYYHLWVITSERARIPEIVALLGDAFIETEHGDSFYLFCRADDVREQRTKFRAVQAHPDVERAFVILNSVFRQNDDRLREWIDAELQRWRLARGK